MHKVRPVFVLGPDRSGTTLLCNLLCRHPQIAGPQHKAHWGIHFSHILSHTLYWGNFRNDNNFIRFMELYSSADFFRLVGGDRDYFYRNRPHNFFEFFLTLMDQFAEREGVAYWTTKLEPAFYYHPKELAEFISLLEQRYGDDCKFIAVKRDYAPLLRSYLHLPSTSRRRAALLQKQTAILLGTAEYIHYYRYIEQIINTKNGLLLLFSDLQNNLEAAAHRVTDYLNLEYSPEMLRRKYKPNTSFLTKEERARSVSKLDLFIGRNLFMPLFSIFPGLAISVIRLRAWTRGKRCPLYWSLLKVKYMRDSFGEKLKRAGNIGLYRILFGEEDC